MQSNLMGAVMGIISRSPQLRSNPNAQSMIQVIQSGDAQRGQQIARNICQSYGVEPAQAVEQARRFFRI